MEITLIEDEKSQLGYSDKTMAHGIGQDSMGGHDDLNVLQNFVPNGLLRPQLHLIQACQGSGPNCGEIGRNHVVLLDAECDRWHQEPDQLGGGVSRQMSDAGDHKHQPSEARDVPTRA